MKLSVERKKRKTRSFKEREIQRRNKDELGNHLTTSVSQPLRIEMCVNGTLKNN